MDFKRFEQNGPSVVEHDGKEYFFIGYLMPNENLIVRIRPVTGWIRENALIADNGAVYAPRFEEKKKGK